MNQELALISPLPELAGDHSRQSLDRYLEAIRQVPILKPQEERELFRRYQEEADLLSAQKIILAHLRFVVYIARGYRNYGLPLADLIQEGNIGLMKAVRHFDPERGVRLITFAVHWIRAEIHEFIIRNWRLVKVATTKAQRRLFFNLRRHLGPTGSLTSRETKQIAKDLKVSPTDVKTMELRLKGQDVSFAATSATDGQEDPHAWAPEEYLTATDADPLESLESTDLDRARHEQLSRALSSLDARSRDIVEQRWLRPEGKSPLKVLAERYGISVERVRQIEAKTLGQLRSQLEAPL
ncbi:RNA polymerase, sigma 32 subunit, RpoH [mine drainage metagenome]|uniref:RNA polymerase, sigma 32 subunit, RpoH n=1 Tax=mine drainage metagenome TaxID=410659 RepID=T1B338_9ZZZZ